MVKTKELNDMELELYKDNQEIKNELVREDLQYRDVAIAKLLFKAKNSSDPSFKQLQNIMNDFQFNKQILRKIVLADDIPNLVRLENNFNEKISKKEALVNMGIRSKSEMMMSGSQAIMPFS